MRPIRSFLFVPGNRPTWVGKAVASGADALILDLEDSVPPHEKDEARASVAATILALHAQNLRLYVRINVDRDGPSVADVTAVCRPGLEGIVLPKVGGPEDVSVADRIIGSAETAAELPERSVRIVPTLETAKGLQFAYECAVHDRVDAIIGATAKDADVSRSLGFRWTPDGHESVYLRSRVVMAARAAGKLPIGGLWQKIDDLEGMRRAANFNRDLGMTGEITIHPSGSRILNEVYSPSADDLAYFEGLIREYEEGMAEGRGAILYRGDHIDLAHVKTARDIVAMSKSLGKTDA